MNPVTPTLIYREPVISILLGETVAVGGSPTIRDIRSTGYRVSGVDTRWVLMGL